MDLQGKSKVWVRTQWIKLKEEILPDAKLKLRHHQLIVSQMQPITQGINELQVQIILSSQSINKDTQVNHKGRTSRLSSTSSLVIARLKGKKASIVHFLIYLEVQLRDKQIR